MQIDDLVFREYLGLSEHEFNSTKSIFADLSPKDLLEPDRCLIRLIRDPNNFYFTAKHILNVTLSPMQCVILKAMWDHPFPMVIASRGFSKCVTGNSFVVTNRGMKRIEDVVGHVPPKVRKYEEGLSLLGESGMNEVAYSWNNGKGPTKKITTRCGYSLEMVPHHSIRVVRDGSIHWVEAADIRIGDAVPIDRSTEWFGEDNGLDPAKAYAMGLLVGDGGYTVRGHILYTTADPSLVDHLTVLWNRPFRRQPSSKYGYLLCGVKEWDSLYSEYGFVGTSSGDKDFPKAVLGAGREAVAAFIRGLADTDGTANKVHEGVEISSKSERMMETLQFALTRFGIISMRRPCWNKKYQRYYYKVSMFGENARRFGEVIGFGLERKQGILESHRHKTPNTNLDVLPSELITERLVSLADTWRTVRPPQSKGYNYSRTLLTPCRLKTYEMSRERVAKCLEIMSPLSEDERYREILELSDGRYFYDRVQSIEDGEAVTYDVHIKSDADRSFVSNGFVSHNSFLMGIYAVLRGTLIQGRKVVITGSGFRQAKTVFNYAETVWHNSPVLQSLMMENSRSGPHHDADRWTLRLGESIITALPVGDGTKVRGERAHDLLGDEFACLDACTLVETDRGLMRIADSFEEDHFRLFTGNDDDLELPAKFIKTPPTQAYKVTVKGGYEFICSSIHQAYTNEGWKLGKDLQKGDRLYFGNHYRFPVNYVEADGMVVDEDLGWAIGLMVAEGAVSSRYSIQVHMTDRECVERFANVMRKYGHVGITHKESYEDSRGWACKESWAASFSRVGVRDTLEKLGLERVTSHDKKIPWSILRSPKSVVTSFLSGLFEGDGTAFHWVDRAIQNKLGVAYYTVSEDLAREVQVLLKKLDIFCSRQTRESKLSDKPQWMLRLNGNNALRAATLFNIPKWKGVVEECYETLNPKLPRGVNRVKGKWRASVKTSEGKYKYVGQYATVEEATAVVEAVESTIGEFIEVKSVELLPGKRHLYDYYLPDSHSFMGNGFRQHNSIPDEIFETVFSGFSVVSLNPVQRMQDKARVRILKELGQWSEEIAAEYKKADIPNQTIISGTAFYQFNHFYKYWKKWKGIIDSRGDQELLQKACGGELDEGLDWRDYCVIRIPYNLIPEGYYDEKQVSRARSTVHTSIFSNEFEAVFASDSNGFFKRSIIEACTTNIPIEVGGKPTQFRPVLRGSSGHRYVFGVDPASENDNFSIVVLEIHEDHRRLVYCWTTNRKTYQERKELKAEAEKEYYAFCARKIRDLMKVFPCDVIALDSQGGGIPISEALQDPDRLEKGELQIWPIPVGHILSDGKDRGTDSQPGLHIVEMVNFAKADYTSEANNGLRKDMEDKVLLFPMYDSVLLATTWEMDNQAGRTYDTLEDCVEEIEELKDELTTIQYSQTAATGRDKWDTPEVKLPGSKKGRMRKDRYSALLMANAAARRMYRALEAPELPTYGGFVGDRSLKIPEGDMYASLPEWAKKDGGPDASQYGWVV